MTMKRYRTKLARELAENRRRNRREAVIGLAIMFGVFLFLAGLAFITS